MDSLLCLLFIIPGVIAFIVDIENGCLYLPQGYAELPTNSDNQGLTQELQLHFYGSEHTLISEPVYVTVQLGQQHIADEKIVSLAKNAKFVKIWHGQHLVGKLAFDS